MSRKKTAVWSHLTYAAAYIYAMIIQSPLGRVMTGYPNGHGANALQKPVSWIRLRCAEWLGAGHTAKVMSQFCGFLARTKVSVYGLIGFLYGILGGVMHGFLHYFSPRPISFVHYSPAYLWIFGIIALLSLPLLFSRRRAGNALLSGKITGWFFVGVLGIPYDGTIQRQAERWHWGKGVFPAILLSLVSVALTLWIHPLALPICFVVFCVIALVLTFPETGAVLCVLSLPFLFVRTDLIFLTAGLLLVTWLSFFAKWLLIRRNLQWSALDMIMVLICLSVALGGMTGAYVTLQSIWQGIISALILSVYFLMTHLIKTRKALIGGMFGLLAVLILTLPTLYASFLHEDIVKGSLSFLTVSKGGAWIYTVLSSVFQTVGAWWHTSGVCLLMMMIPLLLARILMVKRVRDICLLLLALTLAFHGLVMLNAWGGILIATISLLIFGLLYRHEISVVWLLLLPLLLSFGSLGVYMFGQSLHDTWVDYLLLQENQATVWKGIWQLLCEHPAGVGFGTVAYAEIFSPYVNLPYSQISLIAKFIIGLGFPGILLLLLAIFFFVQKTLTCLKNTGSRQNRLYILGGMISTLSLLVYGMFSSALSDIPILFAWIILVGLSHAFVNICWNENQTLTITEAPTPGACDKIYRI